MRFLIFGGALLLLTPTQSFAVSITYTPLGCQQITSLSSAVGFSSIPAGATLASISVEGQTVRYRDDGTAPTASVGTPLPAGLTAWPYSGSLSAIQFIQVAPSATLDVCFYQ
ncbi:MAG TPA: hypothetical protein VMD53_06110 [Rhizomicrobium sp.]|nr:hypothetical protein [Rhizomicrobium sp.]